MSITAAIICAVVYAVINWLDPYTLSWQCLNRPIVVAPLVGLLLGDFQTGIIMGASLEAIFMGISAVGGSIPSDCLSGSIIAVAYAIVVGGDGAMETGLALSLPIGTVMGVAVGIEGLQAGLAACPAWVMTGLAAAGTMMTAVGFGILLSMIWSTDIAVFFFVGFICAKSLGLSSLGIAVIGAAIALTLFFIDKRIIDAKNAVAADPAAGAATPANSEEDFF